MSAFQVDPIQSCDFYKVGHVFQYPLGTQEIFSNLTPRSNRLAPVGFDGKLSHVVSYGYQAFIVWFLQRAFNEHFFMLSKETVLENYRKRMDSSLGPNSVSVDHIAALHDLGYLPISIKVIPEGEVVNVGVPLLTIRNTLPEFYWLTNYLETALSAELWKPITTASIALEYRKILEWYARETGSPKDFVLWQGHDFSLRGMSGLSDGAASGSGHLLPFLGTDTITAMKYLEDFYFGGKTFIGGSVPATEHSVMCAGGETDEQETIRRLVQDIYPSGVVSIVSDTWDFFNVITNIASNLKEVILARTPNEIGLAKVVFRPDSGDPADILCGDPNAVPSSPEYKGAVECLWEIFGGTVTDKGYRLLNQRVGLIYGDSITLPRAMEIMKRLKDKGFASANVVFGIGSFTYQYNTRDTFGMAMKATSAVVNGKRRALSKRPKTDSGTKFSARGLLRVDKVAPGVYSLTQDVDEVQEQGGSLVEIYRDGKILQLTSLEEIRAKINSYVEHWLSQN